MYQSNFQNMYENRNGRENGSENEINMNNIKSSLKLPRNLKTKLNITIVKKFINEVLNEHSDMCKYWENIADNIWGVSFKVDDSQMMAMIQTSFEISILDNNGVNSIQFSQEMEEHEQWSPLYMAFVRKFT